MQIARIRGEIERGQLSLGTAKWLSGTKTVYVASPYAKGDCAQNVRVQILAAEAIRRLGWLPIVPLLSHFWHLISPHDRDYWMLMDVQWIFIADAVLGLPGESEGADLEVALARLLGKPVYRSVYELARGLPSEIQG